MQNWTLFRSVLQAEESLVSNDVVGVAAKLDLHPVRGHWRIDMRAAAGQDDPLIESGRIGTQVPFADERLLIACLLHRCMKVICSGRKPPWLRLTSPDPFVSTPCECE